MGKVVRISSWSLFVAIIFLMISAGFSVAEEGLEFPLRVKYTDLSPIETAELASIYDSAIIVDARNHMEFNVVQMKGAHNFLVGKMKEQDLLSLRVKDGTSPLVFYCNGTTCSKSYKAAAKATKWGFSNVRVYDPGIFHWAQKQPARALFFGKQLTEETVKTAFISKDKFNNANIATNHFIDKANSGKYTVIDIRDPNERSESPIRLSKMKVLAFDLLVSLIEKKSKAVPRSGLLILDNVGKQVKWVQYYLEREGITDYYFLKKGVRQWKKDGFGPDGTK